MRLATREDIYKIDQEALKQSGMTSEQLIEKAGAALVMKFEVILQRQKWAVNSKIGVWCGPGHNGADGKVMARILSEKKYSAHLLEGFDWDPSKYDILIDAYFGVGLNREVSGDVQRQMQKINRAEKRVIAIDIPSGLDANRGVVLGEAVKAQWTLTISPPKPGLFFQEGPRFSGKISAVDIGIPAAILHDNAHRCFLIGPASARKILPKRSSFGNKSNFGHLLVIAGSDQMTGAAQLVSEAAARMGCGYVSVCSPSMAVYEKIKPDFLHLSLQDFFQSELKKYSAVVVGPGLGLGPQTKSILTHLQEYHPKVVVDADALTVLSQNAKNSLPVGWILTPHAGELSRLLKTPARELEEDRLGSVERAVRELNAHILFKGFRTVLGMKGRNYVIGSGNVALAKAGSGDVLSGFIGSLLAQGLPTDQAGALGAFLHGKCADDWLRRGNSNRTLMASDLPELLNDCLRSLKKSP